MSLSVPTPHIAAKPGDFAKTVLMPGDPLRAQFVAEQYLTDARLVNTVRGVMGYTGYWQGVPVSVMASGMGIPSIGIYAYELYNGYGVDNILRIGSAGALQPQVHVRDLVCGMSACTNSAFAAQFGLPGTFAPTASYPLLRTVADLAEERGLRCHVGMLLSSDTFYGDDGDLPAARQANALWAKMGVLAVEMEAAGLYMQAARAGKRALALCTISDSLVTGEALSSADRQTGFGQMIELALSAAVCWG